MAREGYWSISRLSNADLVREAAGQNLSLNLVPILVVTSAEEPGGYGRQGPGASVRITTVAEWIEPYGVRVLDDNQVGAIILFLLIRLAFNGTYQKLIQEDSFIEYTQSIAYLLSSVLSFSIMFRFFRSGLTFRGILYLALSMAMIFVCLEELSWGQRLFYLPLPDYFKEHNVQGELTLHNLDMVQPRLLKLYILIGAFGSFAWLLVPRNIKKYGKDIAAYIVPDWYLMFYFLPVLIVFIYFDMISHIGVYGFNLEFMRVGHLVVWRDQEPAELLLSLGFLFFVVKNRLRLSLTLTEKAARIPALRMILRQEPLFSLVGGAGEGRSLIKTKLPAHQFGSGGSEKPRQM